ncbi:hypothetical protein J6590_036365 [Homalodisca vitripennis]|nr:hypothetical protein J6590_036365 [Homalodisca vitripennis]
MEDPVVVVDTINSYPLQTTGSRSRSKSDGSRSASVRDWKWCTTRLPKIKAPSETAAWRVVWKLPSSSNVCHKFTALVTKLRGTIRSHQSNFARQSVL